jgi:hypothetical protein
MIQLLAVSHPDQPASTWNLLRDAVHEGWQSVDRRACSISERSLTSQETPVTHIGFPCLLQYTFDLALSV